MGSQIRHLWPRWPSPSVLACLNLNLTPLFESLTKDMGQKYGSTVKNLTLGFRPNFRGEFLYMYGSQEKNLGQKVNVKLFMVDPYSVIKILISNLRVFFIFLDLFLLSIFFTRLRLSSMPAFKKRDCGDTSQPFYIFHEAWHAALIIR